MSSARVSTEAYLQRKIIAYAKSLGLVARRNYMGPGAETGRQDVVIFGTKGRSLHIEVKKLGEKPKKLQQYRALQLHRLGHTAIACDDFEQAKRAIDVITG